MTIKFYYDQREALTGKAEEYKRNIRLYLEKMGYSQTSDSIVEGTREDMVFYNPYIAPGKKFVVEAKATNLSIRNFNFAKELINNYYRTWLRDNPNKRYTFMLFIQSVKKRTDWEKIFSENNDITAIKEWIKWFNIKCMNKNILLITENEIGELVDFFRLSDLNVITTSNLRLASLEKEEISNLSIKRKAQDLLNLMNRRKSPLNYNSIIITNVFPIITPTYFNKIHINTLDRRKIYNCFPDGDSPPFIIFNNHLLTFSQFNIKLIKNYTSGELETGNLAVFRSNFPNECSYLINEHLRRIIWKRGVWRVSGENIYYIPIDNMEDDIKYVNGIKERKISVVKKYKFQNDTKYHKKGEINFFLHKSFELNTPTYWNNNYVEIIPRRYYTFDGKKPIDGKIVAKIDATMRNPNFDRSKRRMALMHFWRFYLFLSSEFTKPKEEWFDDFQFGSFLTQKVNWVPEVMPRNQTAIYEFWGVKE